MESRNSSEKSKSGTNMAHVVSSKSFKRPNAGQHILYFKPVGWNNEISAKEKTEAVREPISPRTITPHATNAKPAALGMPETRNTALDGQSLGEFLDNCVATTESLVAKGNQSHAARKSAKEIERLVARVLAGEKGLDGIQIWSRGEGPEAFVSDKLGVTSGVVYYE